MTTASEGRWPFPPVRFEIDPAKTALLIIDMQYYDAHPDYALGKAIEAAEPGAGRYYFRQIRDLVIPNTQRLLAFFRAHGLPILFIAIGSEFEDGRDLSPLTRAKYAQREEFARRAIPTYRGGFEYGILQELGPQPGELVILKTTPGAFASTNLDMLLRNLGVECLIITGVVTDGCVESTARGAADRGYKCVLVSDGSAAHEAASHAATLHTFRKYFGRVQTADEIFAELSARIPEAHLLGPAPKINSGRQT